MKKIILLALILFSSLNYSQNSEEKELEKMKKILPFLMKGLKSEMKSEKELDEKYFGKFHKPWEIEKKEKAEIEEIINALANNYKVEIQENNRLWFSTQHKVFKTIKEIENSDGLLSNLYLEPTKVNIFNEQGISIYNQKNKKIEKIKFISGQINTHLKIDEHPNKLNGKINLVFSEFSKIEFKEFKKTDKNIQFNLDTIKNVQLLKVQRNKAHFVLPFKTNEIEVTLTTNNDEILKKDCTVLPKKVYDFIVTNQLTDENIDLFISQLTYNDLYNKEFVYIYETNGIIENVYAYFKLNPKTLTEKEIMIKL